MSHFIGEIPIDGYVEFHQNTHNPATGVEADADALPTYRIYEENNDTVISSGNLAKRDDANTLGYYYARVQCTTVAGYEAGKLYFIRVRGVVGAVAGSTVLCFRCVAAGHDAESVAGKIDKILGASHFNYVVDTVSVDGNNNLLSARVRLFANKTLAGAATKDGVGEGEFASLTVTGEYTGGVADFTKFVED